MYNLIDYAVLHFNYISWVHIFLALEVFPCLQSKCKAFYYHYAFTIDEKQLSFHLFVLDQPCQNAVTSELFYKLVFLSSYKTVLDL